jgi:hypothetical protein
MVPFPIIDDVQLVRPESHRKVYAFDTEDCPVLQYDVLAFSKRLSARWV